MKKRLAVAAVAAVIISMLSLEHAHAAPPAASYATATNVGLNGGSAPAAVQIADLNGDHIADLGTANFISNDASVLHGNGNGTFGTATNVGVGAFNPDSLAVADLNGDALPDLVTANSITDNVSVLLQRADGSFAPAATFGVIGQSPRSVAVADVNGDHIPDLITANDFTNDVSVLLGDGTGSFGIPTLFPVGAAPVSVAVGDVNGDGAPDLAVANALDNTVSILLGNGHGAFTSGGILLVGASGPSSVQLADFNGDGHPDLVTANFSSANVSVLLGNGDGTFGPAATFGLQGGYGPSSIAVGDVNADGKPDLVTADKTSSGVSVLVGNGDGTFATAQNFGLNGGSAPESVAIADINGDGRPDLATANSSSDNVSVLLNTGPLPCDHTQASAGGSVTVASSGSTCITGGSVGGNLTVPAGASVVLTNATIGGGITANNPGSVTICGTTVGNAVKVSGATGFVLLGDPGDDNCAGNSFRTNITLSSNHRGVELGHNHIGANTSVTGTTGVGLFPEDVGAELEGNTIGGGLACSGNSSIINDGQPNSVGGARSGQCTGSF